MSPVSAGLDRAYGDGPVFEAMRTVMRSNRKARAALRPLV